MNKKFPLSIRLRELVFSLIGRKINLKPCPAIFCFHSVSEDGWLYSVDPKDFELFIKKLSDSRAIVDLDDLLQEDLNKRGEKVAITFDDGYENVFSDAYPILKKYKVTACVFVNGLSDDGEFGRFSSRRLLSVKQIKILKRAGWEIGYHTKTHPDLRKLNDKGLYEEIIKSKKSIEKKIGFKIRHFAYPFGVFNRQTLSFVERADYKYAFIVDGGGFSKIKLPYETSRVLIDKYIKVSDLKIITSVQGLYFNKLLTKLLRVKDNLL